MLVQVLPINVVALLKNSYSYIWEYSKEYEKLYTYMMD